MTHYLLEALKESGVVPRFHGNGFIQVRFGGRNTRLHVWDPDLPPIPNHNATKHSHVWDLESSVYYGTVIHRTFQHTLSPTGDWDLYYLGESDHGKASPKSLAGPMNLQETGEYRMVVGSMYRFRRNILHETEVSGFAATLMHKSAEPTSILHRPMVACPHAQRPVDAFAPEFQPPVDQLWAGIEQIFLKMNPHHLNQLEAHLG